MSGAASRVRVGLDVTPLVGHRSGIGRVTAALVDGLRDRDDVDLTGVLISARGAEAVAEQAPGLPIRRTRLPARLGRRWWRGVPAPIAGLGGLGPASADLDVVHGVNFVLPPHRARAGLVTIHDLTAWTHPERVDAVSRDLPALVDRALGRGAHVHVVSQHVADEVVERLGVAPARVHVVHNGVDTSTTAGVATRGRESAGGRPYVLALGTIEPRKGLPVAVEALAGLDDDVVLVCAGASGWGSDELDRVVDAHGVRDRVVRLGAVDDRARADLLAGAEVLVYPSLDEGFGLPPLEAMDAGCPVVTTTAGSLPEVVGDAAALVEPGDGAALAVAIAAIMSDVERRDRLIAAGRTRVERFRWPERIDEFVELYRSL